MTIPECTASDVIIVMTMLFLVWTFNRAIANAHARIDELKAKFPEEFTESDSTKNIEDFFTTSTGIRCRYPPPSESHTEEKDA